MVNDSWRILKPLLALPLLMQGGFVVERAIASLIGVRVVASVDYAKFITETGMALLAIPLGLAGLSAWSGLDPDALKERLQKIVPFILIVTVPFSSFLLFHNRLLVKVLYARGAFDAESTTITASVLAGLAAGFWAQVAGYVLIKALNSQLRNREVVLFVAAALSANILVIVSLFKVLGPLALGLGASVNGVILLFLTTRVFSLSKKIIPVIAWLGAGAVPYSFVAFRIAGDTKIAMAAALLLFCIYWGLFIFAIPLLRSSFFQVLARFIKKP
jgi:putative peptidoglycan lipid II flippase